jgi:hypothetical protein
MGIEPGVEKCNIEIEFNGIQLLRTILMNCGKAGIKEKRNENRIENIGGCYGSVGVCSTRMVL